MLARLLRFVLVSGSLLLWTWAPCPVSAQDGRPYYHDVPPASRIVKATDAASHFGLFDGSRPTGINTRWEGALIELAVHFAPIVRYPNRTRPRRIEDALAEGPVGAELIIDQWSVSSPDHVHRVGRQLDVRDLLRSNGTGQQKDLPGDCPSSHDDHNEDWTTKLRWLVGCYGPVGRITEPLDPGGRSEDILYFDFLGKGPEDWRRDLNDARPRHSHVYVHPFVEKVERPDLIENQGEYRFVLQYWYFYPFNDFVNNHEGDWEHINVHVTTRGAMARPRNPGGLLTQDEVRLLQDRSSIPLEELRIGRLDYYFHHSVVVLDLVELGIYDTARCYPHENDEKARYPRDPLGERSTLGSLATGWEYAARVLCKRHGLYPTRWTGRDTTYEVRTTHPIAYSAGKPLEWTRLFALPGARDRNGHGKYPFLGVWKRVGPLGVNELVDHEGEEKTGIDFARGSCPPEGGDYSLHWICFGEEDLTLVPDWDAFFPRVCQSGDGASSDDARRECAYGFYPESAARWFWLFLPIRWGYPVTPSPGSGLIPRYNVGQTAPMGPAFQGGWNRTGPSPGFPLYRPHIRDSGVLAITDLYWKSGGFLNNILQLGVFLPQPFLPALLVAGARNPPMITPQPEAPDRGLSIALGMNLAGPSSEMAGLLSASDPSAATETRGRPELWMLPLWHAAVRYHIGRFSTGMAYHRESVPGRAVFGEGGSQTGDVESYALMGVLRASSSHGSFQPFVQLGYGWSKWIVDDVTRTAADGVEVPTERRIGETPLIWTWKPDDLTLGVGAEVLFVKNLPVRTLPIGRDGWDVGVELTYESHWSRIRGFHRLGLESDPGTVRRDRIGLAVTVGR